MKKILVTTAIIATLAIAGTSLAGQHYQHGEKMKAKAEEVLKNFPADKAELVRNSFEKMRSERKGEHQGRKDARDEIRSLLTAETFNKGVFLEKMEQMHKAHETKRRAKDIAIADLASQLNVEQRKALVEILPNKGHGKHGKKHSN